MCVCVCVCACVCVCVEGFGSEIQPVSEQIMEHCQNYCFTSGMGVENNRHKSFHFMFIYSAGETAVLVVFLSFDDSPDVGREVTT